MRPPQHDRKAWFVRGGSSGGGTGGAPDIEADAVQGRRAVQILLGHEELAVALVMVSTTRAEPYAIRAFSDSRCGPLQA